MMKLDHYLSSFLKWLAMLNTLIVMRKWSLRLVIKTYSKIWGKISSLIGKLLAFVLVFDGEPVYNDNDQYIKTKIKSYEDKINTKFQGKKIPKEAASHKHSSKIMLDSAIRVNKRYFPQIFLKECKDKIKKNKMKNLINDDLELSSADNESDK